MKQMLGVLLLCLAANVAFGQNAAFYNLNSGVIAIIPFLNHYYHRDFP